MTVLSRMHRSNESLAHARARREFPALLSAAEAHFGSWGRALYAAGIIEPMYALAVQRLPQGQEWLYEVKFDGYRCLVGRDSSRVTLWSRRENLFTNQFPHIARAC